MATGPETVGGGVMARGWVMVCVAEVPMLWSLSCQGQTCGQEEAEGSVGQAMVFQGSGALPVWTE